MLKPIAAILLITAALTPMAHAVETSVNIELGAASDFDRRSVVYNCEAGEPITVTYINAAPNFLALVPIADEPEPYLFASVISASGARYAASHWIWWTDGLEASLYDATLGDDADPVLTCSEFIQTP